VNGLGSLVVGFVAVALLGAAIYVFFVLLLPLALGL